MSDEQPGKHDLEFNKLAAAILFAGVIAMVCGFIADAFYQPKEAAKRGFHVDVVEDSAGDAPVVAKPLVDAGTLLAHADAAKGNDIVQKKCTSCHDFSQGGPNKVGPNLYGIVGRGVGSKADFSYSDGVKNHGGTWGYAELNQWLYAPAQYIKGTKMGFAGLKNDEERGDVIAYLKSISPGAPAIPAPAPAAAEPKAAGGDEKKTDTKVDQNAVQKPAVKDTGVNAKAGAVSKDVIDSKGKIVRQGSDAVRQDMSTVQTRGAASDAADQEQGHINQDSGALK